MLHNMTLILLSLHADVYTHTYTKIPPTDSPPRLLFCTLFTSRVKEKCSIISEWMPAAIMTELTLTEIQAINETPLENAVGFTKPRQLYAVITRARFQGRSHSFSPLR